MKKGSTQEQCINKGNHDSDLLARKIIRSGKELPRWFDITKYQAASTLDAKAWHAQLQARAECLQLDKDATGIVETFLKAACEDYLAAIAITPILDCAQSATEMIKSIFNVEIDNFKSIWTGVYAPTAVHHISIIHTYAALREMLTVDLYQLLAQWWDETNSLDGGSFFTQAAAGPEWFDKPVTWRDYALFKINLNAPDDLILAQCKVVLSKARKDQAATPAKRCFTAKNFNKWHEFGVLPYCDLTIWANHENITIPQRVIADAIFIDGEKGEESIRRVTVPLVSQLMGNEALYQLHAQSLL